MASEEQAYLDARTQLGAMMGGGSTDVTFADVAQSVLKAGDFAPTVAKRLVRAVQTEWPSRVDALAESFRKLGL